MIAGIVLAGGSASRFGSRKQFLELAPGLRLVDASVAVVRDVADQVVLVLPEGTVWRGAAVDRIAAAGSTRLDSVANALAVVDPAAEIIVIHDAAHPLAPARLARDAIAAVRAGADAAVPLLDVADVIKRRRADGLLETVGRDGVGLAQCPQAFSRAALLSAHANRQLRGWEDSELVERMGGRVVAVPGDPANIHVVDARDLELARALAKKGV